MRRQKSTGTAAAKLFWNFSRLDIAEAIIIGKIHPWQPTNATLARGESQREQQRGMMMTNYEWIVRVRRGEMASFVSRTDLGRYQRGNWDYLPDPFRERIMQAIEAVGVHRQQRENLDIGPKMLTDWFVDGETNPLKCYDSVCVLPDGRVTFSTIASGVPDYSVENQAVADAVYAVLLDWDAEVKAQRSETAAV